jgi:predicted ATP-grasp superfamily ATP-dependent carboligase
MPGPPALILGGRGTAVPVARSLGRAGVRVMALGADPWEPVRFSRFCARYVSARRRGGAVQRAWLEWLAREAGTGAVLIPCSDDGLELMACHSERLRELGYVPSQEPALVHAMLDKTETYRLARAAGIATPRHVAIEGSREIDPERLGIGFPCALKPVVSHRFARHFSRKAFVVRDTQELRAARRLTEARNLRMMLTEIIPGSDDQLVAYVGFLDDGGRPLMQFTHRKLRQWPNGFGLACYAVSGWEPEVARLGVEFLRHVGAHGAAYVEFKRDARSGVWNLIECNYRFTIEFVGVAEDLPLLAYRRALGLADPALASVRLDSYLWNPIQDVLSMWSLRRRGELRGADWLRSFRRPLRAHVFRPDDPLPTVGHHAGVAAQRARARLRLKAPPAPVELAAA